VPKHRYEAAPTQSDHGETISIMLNGITIAKTLGNTQVDAYLAGYIVSALILSDEQGNDPIPQIVGGSNG
jgi:hypothetical protein